MAPLPTSMPPPLELAEPPEQGRLFRPRGLLTRLDPGHHALTRFVFLRLLGFIYAVAFTVATQQLVPLVGARGLSPAAGYLARVRLALGPGEAWWRLPTLFWLDASDTSLRLVSSFGLALALCVMAGLANAGALSALWILYLSVVQVGQIFWGYGWESLLLETGFLAIFLASPLDPRPSLTRDAAPPAVIWLLRWVLFRLMFGAGLIKLRGDPCWRDLTCLLTHYETQPLPNPLSPYLHRLPRVVQQGSVLFNHYAEIVAPFMIFGPRRWRIAGGLSIVVFQLLLIASGNLSWLNWLSITLAVTCFDDRFWLGLCPARLRPRIEAMGTAGPLSPARKRVLVALCTMVAVLSVGPVLNLLSPSQRMNSSFDPFYLVNTYGAFGSIGRERYEIVLEGTRDEEPADARWEPYEFRCKPGDPARRPCVVAPYQYRIDWQMWFAAMSDYRHHPWIVHLVAKLLEGDTAVAGLLARDPFAGTEPPRFVRAELYRYRFADTGDPAGVYWVRTWVREYLPPLDADDPELRAFLEGHGWR